MMVNADKPGKWKIDIAQSVDMYNNWFLLFAPKTYHDTRITTTEQVKMALELTSNLTNITPDTLLKQRLFLLSCNLSEELVEAKYPALWRYLQTGREKGIPDRYLCAHRTPWYSQEKRAASLFVCSYMGRQKSTGSMPFRFILNRSNAVVTNSYYVLYPKPYLFRALQESPMLVDVLWRVLKGISVEHLLNEGRVYGGGLYKIEPKELANVPMSDLPTVLSDVVFSNTSYQGLWQVQEDDGERFSCVH